MAAIDSVVAWSVGVTALIGLAVLLIRLLRAVLRIADRFDQAWEDWSGSEERPGVPARPGVMARLGQHDERLADHEVRIAHVEGQLSDGGDS
ncbi:hypothetical protein [Streptomyces sediminimaris]|uniref:hypothetical protein n=1 Tax=Streptomyces sediminimaris TaxID=3383721 RepID=UPI0039997127